MSLREDYPDECAAWRQSAEGSRFMDIPIAEMDRDDLLVVIGYFYSQQEEALYDQD